MALRTTCTGTALLVMLTVTLGGQDGASVIAAAAKAMGVTALNSITYTGTARNGAFGQSKAIGEPLGRVNATQITQYTRTLTFGAPADANALVSRATGPRQPPTVPGTPPPMPGVFNQNVTGAQAATNWAQALNVWTTPWGFLTAAQAAGNATVRRQGGQQVVSFSPAAFKSPSRGRMASERPITRRPIIVSAQAA